MHLQDIKILFHSSVSMLPSKLRHVTLTSLVDIVHASDKNDDADQRPDPVPFDSPRKDHTADSE